MSNLRKKKGEAVGLHEDFDPSIVSPGPKKIFIEQTTFLSILALIVFKAISFLLPDDVSLLYSVPEFLLSLPSDPRAYPSLFGLLLSFLTWHTMYLDSAVPGVDPPTPLSPSKYREASGSDFHTNFLFAMIIGPMVTVFMYTGLV